MLATFCLCYAKANVNNDGIYTCLERGYLLFKILNFKTIHHFLIQLIFNQVFWDKLQSFFTDPFRFN